VVLGANAPRPASTVGSDPVPRSRSSITATLGAGGCRRTESHRWAPERRRSTTEMFEPAPRPNIASSATADQHGLRRVSAVQHPRARRTRPVGSVTEQRASGRLGSSGTQA
jgi:hypothetical protein